MRAVALLLLWFTSLPLIAADVTVLTYHDVVDNPDKDQYAVSTLNFKRQLEYLRSNRYQPISLSAYIEAIRNRTPLPRRAVLLTFDDGLESYRTTVVPLLRQYNYPSVLSIVTSWVDGSNVPAEYGNKILGWQQLSELQKNPLVEIVSHSHNLHRWIISSPQNTYAPSAITRAYSAEKKSYETESGFKRRIREDLLKTRSRFVARLGRLPVALTWPYGEYDPVTMEIARSVGFQYQLTLDEGQANHLELPRVRRYMLLRDHSLNNLQAMLGEVGKTGSSRRFVEFGLDLFAHISPENHPLLIQQLVDRIGSLGVDTVVVDPFSTERTRAFFPNHHLPLESDVLNGVLDKIQAQLGIEQVYLRFPAGTEQLPDHVFSELARSSRFNAVLFDRYPPAARRQAIRKALTKYLPDVYIGVWLGTDEEADVLIIKTNQSARVNLKENRKKTMVFVDRRDYLTASGLSDALRELRKQGISAYGFGPLNYLAGAQAQPELVEAMAPPVGGGGR